MAISIALVLIVIGALIFHFVNPWAQTPIASNWQQMDIALQITFLLTGIAFVLINLFVAYAVMRFRHREGVRASPGHGDKRLEWWLIGMTTLGIVALLAPGLSVYAELIQPPRDALLVEVQGQQWQWHYRFPGANGKLGHTDSRFIGPGNPFGLNPADPDGQDNRLVDGQEVHLPLNQPVKFLLRSEDVLHDFFVPQFRTRMNMVPGMVTTFWLTPTRAGRFEVMCAQLCGLGHYNMRSYVVVEAPAAFRAWLAAQPTYASQVAGASASVAATASGIRGGAEAVRRGALLAQARGCVACHSVNGSAGVGPTWKGLAGSPVSLSDGRTITADEAYLRESIVAPQAKIVRGYGPVMPKQQFTEAELAELLAYIKSVKGGG